MEFLFEALNSDISDDKLLKRFRYHYKAIKKGLNFCKMIPQAELQLQILKKIKISFGPQTKTKTLIFDLDETLIHSSRNCKYETKQILIASLPSLGQISIGLNVRPYLIPVLSELAQYFELALFTASEKNYANFILEQIPELSCLIPQDRRIYRQSCVYFHEYGHYAIKPLDIIQDRSIQNIVLIDNNIQSFTANFSNGIICLPFINEDDDQELLKLKDFCLNELKETNDVRKILQEKFQLEQAIENGDWINKKNTGRKLSFLSKQSV